MKDTMTSRERVAVLLRRELPDRMGCSSIIGGKHCLAGLKEGYPEGVAPEDYFGYDLAFAGGWIDTAPLRGVNELMAETDEWTLTKNGAGASLNIGSINPAPRSTWNFDCVTPQRWEEIV